MSLPLPVNTPQILPGSITDSQINDVGEAKLTAGTSVPAAPTAGANAGTTPPAPVLTPGSTDQAGNITFGTGTTPALGDQVDVVFGTAFKSVPRSIQVAAGNAVTGLKQVCVVAKSATGFSIGLAVAPAGSQANTVYSVDYSVRP